MISLEPRGEDAPGANNGSWKPYCYPEGYKCVSEELCSRPNTNLSLHLTRSNALYQVYQVKATKWFLKNTVRVYRRILTLSNTRHLIQCAHLFQKPRKGKKLLPMGNLERSLIEVLWRSLRHPLSIVYATTGANIFSETCTNILPPLPSTLSITPGKSLSSHSLQFPSVPFCCWLSLLPEQLQLRRGAGREFWPSCVLSATALHSDPAMNDSDGSSLRKLTVQLS